MRKQIGILALGALLTTCSILFINSNSYNGAGIKNTGSLLALNQNESIKTTPNIKFGIQLDSLDISYSKIGRNELLSTILLKHHIPYPTIDKVVKSSKGIFDVRQIVPGETYAILTDKNDKSKKAK